MQKIISNVQSLSLMQKVIALFSIFFVCGAAVLFFSATQAQNFRLLYADLDLRASGQIVEHLESQNIAFDLKNNAIYVPQEQVARIRMDLAARGLPKSNAPGYELLDKINGFQTTNRMYNVNYVRALEGELAQTIAGSDVIEKARVHIAYDQGATVLRPSQVSASVMIVAVSGVTLGSEQARAIQHLVSSAVVNLSPQNVNVLDSAGNLLTDRKSEQLVRAQEEEKIRDKLMRILAARFGQSNAVVEISIEQSFQDEVIRERIIDPDSRVAMHQESEELQSQRDEVARGIAGVASNLPERDGARDGGLSDTETQSRAKIQYEVSKTEREILNPAGAVKRMSVAVLVNKDVLEQSAQSLEQLSTLLSAAAGVDAERGDSITVEAMSFAALPEFETGAGAASTGFGATSSSFAVPSWAWAVLALPLAAIGALVLRRRGGVGQANVPHTDLVTAQGQTVSIAGPQEGNDAELVNPEDALMNVISSQEDSAVMLIKNWLDEGKAA